MSDDPCTAQLKREAREKQASFQDIYDEGFKAGMRAGEIAMREKAANVCRTWDELIPAKWIADKIEALAISGAEESKKEKA